MPIHTMILSEEDPAHAGFSRRYYAMIEIAISGFSWQWTQVDSSGKHIGQPHSSFDSEIKAKGDALEKLKGDRWEE